MFGIGPTELVIILVLALIIFGPKRLPEIGRTIGKAINDLKKASQGIEDSVKKEIMGEDEGELEEKSALFYESSPDLTPREKAALRSAQKKKAKEQEKKEVSKDLAESLEETTNKPEDS